MKELLVRQVQSSVQFEKTLEKCLEAGAEEFIEIGLGNTLAGFVKKTAKSMGKDISVYSIDSVASMKTYLTKRKKEI